MVRSFLSVSSLACGKEKENLRAGADTCCIVWAALRFISIRICLEDTEELISLGGGASGRFRGFMFGYFIRGVFFSLPIIKQVTIETEEM